MSDIMHARRADGQAPDARRIFSEALLARAEAAVEDLESAAALRASGALR